MKNNYEVQGDITKIFVSDYKGNVFTCLIDTSRFHELKNHCWFAKKSSYSPSTYVMTVEMVDGVKKNSFLHRVLTSAPKGMVVDHINHDSFDNRLCNLRVCTRSENSQNRKGPTAICKSGVRNVSWNKQNQRWIVNMTVNKKKIYLGVFLELEEAKKVAEDGRRMYMPYATN